MGGVGESGAGGDGGGGKGPHRNVVELRRRMEG